LYVKKTIFVKKDMFTNKGFGYKVSGIYMIINTKNGKIYIGSSKHIYYRIRRHLSELRRGFHANSYLQNSFVKNGESSFYTCIIEECLEQDLTKKEQFYINLLKPDYNITTEVIRNTPSKESREKTSRTLKAIKAAGLLKYPRHDDKKQPISIYTLNCKLLGEYESQHAAAIALVKLYPDLKHGQSVISQTIKMKNRRKTPRYKNHFLIARDCECKNYLKNHTNDTIKE